MTTTHDTHGSAGDAPLLPLPADLESVAGWLDRLGAADRQDAPGSLAERAFLASVAGLRGVPQDVMAVAAELDDLGAAERAAVPASVPERAFAASVGELPTEGLRLIGAEHAVRPARSYTLRRFTRIAATFALMGGAAAAVWIGMPRNRSTPALNPLASLTMDDLVSFDGVDGFATLAADASELDQEIQGDWLGGELSTEGSL